MVKNLLYVLLAFSLFIFGFTVGRFTDVIDAGGKTFRQGKALHGVKAPALGELSDKEKEVAKMVIGASDDLAKAFVKNVGKNAEDEEKWKKTLETFEKNPAQMIALAGRTRPAQAAADEDPNKVYTVTPGDVPSKGPADAPIHVVEFSDFQCPFCSRGYQTMKQLEAKYPGKIRYEYVSKILPFHQKAPLAHAAAYAAKEQGKFWEFHDKAFENQQQLGEEAYVQWAKDLGLNLDKFKKDMSVDKYKAEFDRMDKIATELGVQGTPTFFINGKKVRGAKPIESFTEIIDPILSGTAKPAEPKG